MNQIEKSSWNIDVSKQLGIGESTLRKWCIELEANGYTFIKGAKGTRAFSEHDLVALLYFKTLTRAKNHTMKQAAIAVVEKYSKKGENESAENASLQGNRSNLDKMINDLLEYTKRQEEFNNYLQKRLDKQDQYIKEILEKLNIKKQTLNDKVIIDDEADRASVKKNK